MFTHEKSLCLECDETMFIQNFNVLYSMMKPRLEHDTCFRT